MSRNHDWLGVNYNRLEMLKLVIFVAFCTAVVFGLPPQVKSITHTFNETRLDFWYPGFVEHEGRLRFVNELRFTTTVGETYWSIDKLRSTSFFCGSTKCANSENPVAAAWVINEAKLSRLKQEVLVFQGRIAVARTTQISMEEYVSRNTCGAIKLGPAKPDFACTESDAQEVALATCTIREFGSKICEKGGKEVLDFDAPKFLKDAVAREGCATVVGEITGERYNLLEKTVRKYTTELPITLISEALDRIWKPLKEFFDWSVVAVKTSSCIPSGIQLCRSQYSAWQDAQTEHFSKYDTHIKYCQEAEQRLAGAIAEVASNESHLSRANQLISETGTKKEELEHATSSKDVAHALQLL